MSSQFHSERGVYRLVVSGVAARLGVVASFREGARSAPAGPTVVASVRLAGPAAVASFREALGRRCWGADGWGGAAGGPAAVASFREGASAGACWGAAGWHGAAAGPAAVASFREGASVGACWGAAGWGGAAGGPAAVASFREGASVGACWAPLVGVVRRAGRLRWLRSGKPVWLRAGRGRPDVRSRSDRRHWCLRARRGGPCVRSRSDRRHSWLRARWGRPGFRRRAGPGATIAWGALGGAGSNRPVAGAEDWSQPRPPNRPGRRRAGRACRLQRPRGASRMC